MSSQNYHEGNVIVDEELASLLESNPDAQIGMVYDPSKGRMVWAVLSGSGGGTGAQGPPGDPGAAGSPGDVGATGPQGNTGPQGSVGPNGAIDILTDVDTTTAAPGTGDGMVWNGTLWVPRSRWASGTLAARPDPTLSTTLVGDAYFAEDDNGGTLYRCKGGSPKTWQKQAPGVLETGGVELGYVQATSNFATSSASFVDISGFSLTIQATGKPIKIEIGGDIATPSVAAKNIIFGVYDVTASAQVAQFTAMSQAASAADERLWSIRLQPAAGPRTYKVQARVDGGTNGGYYATSLLPFFMQILAV